MALHHDHDHDHHHDHGHHHGPGHAHVHAPPGMDPRTALLISLVLNGVFLVVEAVAGWLTGSLALLSDAAHMASDVGALVLALGAAQLARRPATLDMTFGLRRTEVLGAFVNGLALFAAVGIIVWEAVERLTHEAPPVAAVPVLIVGLIGLAINLGSAWALWRSDRENLNVRGALAHMMADALGSVGAVLAAVLVMVGLPAADAAVSLVIALLVAWGAGSVVRDAGRVLLQLPPPGFDVRGLLRDLRELEGIVAVHDLHVWTLDGRAPIVSAHLVTGEAPDPVGLVERAVRVSRERHRASHATFQIEAPWMEACGHTACGAHTSAPHPGARDPKAPQR